MRKYTLIITYLSLLPLLGFSQSAVEFIENQGQWKDDFAFKAMTSGGDIYLEKGGYTINLSAADNHSKIHDYKHGHTDKSPTLSYHAYRVSFLNANSNHTFSQHKQQDHYYNYYLGQDAKRWKSGIHPSLSVDYKELYPNITAHFYSDNNQLKYDLVVAPGANTKQIAMQYEGVQSLKIKEGDLILETSLGESKELKPYAYQFINGDKKEVACNYEISGKDKNIVGFKFPKGYDRSFPLIIDPVLIFCSFSGSAADNWGTSATYDQNGNYYGGGFVLGTGYPATVGAYDLTYNGGNVGINGIEQDISILKFNDLGNTLIYATYLGGTSNDQPHSLIVDSTTGNLIVAGRTYSSDYPTSTSCYDPSYNGGADLVVTVFNGTGSALIGSTFIGGSADDGVNVTPVFTSLVGLKHNYGDDARSEVIIDNNANIYVAAMTRSTNFPTSFNAFQGTLGGQQDGVIFQLSPNCSNLIWSTFAGGSSDDACYVLTFDKQDPTRLYVAGGTSSSNFPSTTGVLNSNFQGGIDGFVMRINANAKNLVASTFIGTNTYDQVYGVQTDDSNNVFIMGQTQGIYPVTPGVYSNPTSPQFITKLDPNLSNILVSTVFGTGSLTTTNISPTAFLVDRCGNIYVSGWGGPTGGNPGSTLGLPVSVAPATPLKSTTDGSDFYYFALSRNMVSLLYASFFGLNSTGGLGGEHVDGGTSRFDPNGVIYQAICAACGNTPGFPTTIGSYAPTNGSTNCNLGAVKIDFQLQDPDAEASAGGATKGCAPHQVSFTNNSISATGYIWNFGDGSPLSTQATPTHTYLTAGTYTVSLIAENPNGCTYISDTDLIVITVLDDSIQAGFTVRKVDSCGPYTANFTNTSTFNNGAPNPWTTYSWNFGDGTSFTGTTPPMHNFPGPQSFTITLIMTDSLGCNSPDTLQIIVDFSTSVVLAAFQVPDSICLPANVNFNDLSTNANTYAWTFGDGGTSTAQNPTHTYNAAGQYTVKLVAENLTTCNLRDSLEKTINIFPSPTAAFNFTPNPPEPNKALNFINQSVGGISNFWDFGDGTTSTDKDPTKVYEKDGFYDVCLTVTNEFGCKDSACRRVRGYVIPLADVPTGFSPNGDGKNDEIRVLGYGIESMVFKIFNRWGELVFQTTDKYKGWNGTYKGEPQEMEAYGYTLDVTFFDNTRIFKKGNITLIR